jgi:oligopeptide/dipeptide ABC transporter ATP-binding protein
MAETLLEIEGLRKYFYSPRSSLSRNRSVVRAVEDIRIAVLRGETLGLVGESGCGKSTLGRLIMRLEEPSAGSIRFAGEDIRSFRTKALKGYRRQVQMIFQDPYSSLNPRQTAGAIIGEPLLIHHPEDRGRHRERIAEIMAIVGLSREQMKRYPHEFSGGQRQRIGIARALILHPELIVADEPVSSLDVSIQAQILNLMKRLQKEYGLTYLFIAHDLGVVRHMSDRIAVMYLGRIVEIAPAGEICDHPLHPYTQALLSAIPILDPSARQRRMRLQSEISLPTDPLTGCPFHARCPQKDDRCQRAMPVLKEAGKGHWVACRKGL